MRPLALLLVLGSLVLAQEEGTPPPKVELDATSKKLLDAWQKRHYHLGRAGVKKASYRIQATIAEWGASGTLRGDYKWDGEKGTIEWDNEGLAQGLAMRGWGQARFDGQLNVQDYVEMLAGARVTATNEGGNTVLTLTGRELGPKRLVFDADGVLKTMEVTAGNAMGKMDVKIAFEYRKVGDRYLDRRSTVEVEIPNMGMFKETTEYEHKELGGYHVVTKMSATGEMGGAPGGTKVFELLDWKIEDARGTVKMPAAGAEKEQEKENAEEEEGEGKGEGKGEGEGEGEEESEEEEDGNALQLDDLSRTMFERWRKMEYHLGREGVEKISYRIVVKEKQGGVTVGTSGEFVWDGGKSTLHWDNEKLGARLAQQGWSARDQEFRVSTASWESQFAGSKLVGVAGQDGSVVVTADTPGEGQKAFRFDPDGTLAGMKISMKSGRGPVTLDFRFDHVERGGKLQISGWEWQQQMYKEKTTLTFAEVGGYFVPVSAQIVGSMGPREVRNLTLEFQDIKLNDDVG